MNNTPEPELGELTESTEPVELTESTELGESVELTESTEPVESTELGDLADSEAQQVIQAIEPILKNVTREK